MGDLGPVIDTTPDEGFIKQSGEFLKNLREFTTEKAGDILTGPVSGALGPTGEGITRGMIGALNPLPADLTDAARDAAYIAVLGPGGKILRQMGKMGQMAAGPVGRVAAGMGGAAGGAALEGKEPIGAAERAGLGLAGGELLGEFLGKVGQAKRQQAQDIKNVTGALNPILGPGQAPLPPSASGIYERVVPKGTGTIGDVATERYQKMLDDVERIVDPTGGRALAIIPEINPGQPSSFREIVDFIREKTPKVPKEGVSEAAPSTRKMYRQKIEARETLLGALESDTFPSGVKKPDPVMAQDQKAAQMFRNETKAMFKDFTVSKLMKAPGVLDKDGTVNMERLQTAFKREQAAGRVPADVSADLQAAIWRGAKPPATDRPSPETLSKTILGELGAMGGLTAGMAVKHPYMGMEAGRGIARKLASKGPLYVGETVGPGPLKPLGQFVGSQAAQELESIEQ